MCYIIIFSSSQQIETKKCVQLESGSSAKKAKKINNNNNYNNNKERSVQCASQQVQQIY